MIYGITLILLGVLAVPSLVLAKRPDAKELFDKVAPYQGFIGLISAIWGVLNIIKCIFNLGMLSDRPIYWITWSAVSVVQAALGFILGYGMIRNLILSKNPEASEKGEQLLKRLMPLQGTLGLAAVALGFWMVIYDFFW